MELGEIAFLSLYLFEFMIIIILMGIIIKRKDKLKVGLWQLIIPMIYFLFNIVIININIFEILVIPNFEFIITIGSYFIFFGIIFWYNKFIHKFVYINLIGIFLLLVFFNFIDIYLIIFNIDYGFIINIILNYLFIILFNFMIISIIIGDKIRIKK